MSKHSVYDVIEKAVDCLDDARELLDGKRFDASLNRSYYTMFHCIQALLSTIDVIAKSHKGSHNAFLKGFILSNQMSKELGLALKSVNLVIMTTMKSFRKKQLSRLQMQNIS